jgi:hypothetical protein
MTSLVGKKAFDDVIGIDTQGYSFAFLVVVYFETLGKAYNVICRIKRKTMILKVVFVRNFAFEDRFLII